MPVLHCSVPQEKFCMCVQMPGVYWANTARLRTTGQARFAGKEKQKSKYFDRHINTTHSCQPTVLSHLQPPSCLAPVIIGLTSSQHPKFCAPVIFVLVFNQLPSCHAPVIFRLAS